MKAYVDADELYPVYSLSETKRGICDEIEVDAQTFKRWTKAYTAFYAAQDEVRAAIKAARAAKVN